MIVFDVPKIPSNQEVFDFIAAQLQIKFRFVRTFHLSYEAGVGGYFTDGTYFCPLFGEEGDRLIVEFCKKYIGEHEGIKKLEIKLDPKEKELPVLKVEMYAVVQDVVLGG